MKDVAKATDWLEDVTNHDDNASGLSLGVNRFHRSLFPPISFFSERNHPQSKWDC
jgi:hypothetical protein